MSNSKNLIPSHEPETLAPEQTLLINLVKKIPKDKQETLAKQIIEDYDNDKLALAEWEANRNRYYKLWTCYREEKNEPWLGASNICIPLLGISANQFHARAYQSIFAPPGMVRTIPVGANDIKRAENVEKYLNYQVLYEMEEYEDVFDQTLLQLPINGCCFKKLFQSATEKRPVSEYISGTELILPYRTRNFKSARRITQELWLHYDELQERNEAKLYENFDKVSETSTPPSNSQEVRKTADTVTGENPSKQSDEPHLVLECHRNYDLGDGLKPYVFTVDHASQTLLRAASRTFEVGAEKLILNYFIDYHFIRNPEGFYSLGFGHFLEPLIEMANTVFNQIIDAGKISNQPWGFYGRRAGFKAKEIKLHPGKMIPVEDATQVFFPQMQRVDMVLFQVLGLIQQYVEQFTSVSDPILGRQTKGVERPTASGTIATIEQGLVTFTVMTKRIFRSLRKELRLLMTLNQIFLPDIHEYRIMESRDKIAFPDIKREDFSGVKDVIPIGDPSYASRMTKRKEAIEIYQLVMSNPLIIGTPPDKETGKSAIPPNLRAMHEALRDVLITYEKQNVDKLLPELPEEPMSPENENARFVQGDYRSPVQGENHMRHMQVHVNFMSLKYYINMPPKYQQLLQQHLQETQAAAYQEATKQAQLGGGVPGGTQPGGLPRGGLPGV